MSDDDFDNLVTHSSIYKQCEAERESIVRHQKRLELATHRQVDFETALVDWMLKRRRSWLLERTQQIQL